MHDKDYYFDTPAEGPGRYSPAFATFIKWLMKGVFGIPFRLRCDGIEALRDGWLKGGEGDAGVDGKPPRGLILAGNHRSYLDPIFPLIAMSPRPIRFMSQEGFLAIPVIGYLASKMGVFPITRKTADAQSLKRAVKMLKRGELVGIFPEGTRMRDGRRGKAHKGIGLVAHMANVDVLPYRIWNTQRIKPKGSTFPHFPRVVVRFGTVMSLNDARYDNLPKNDKYKLFAQDIMDAIYSLDPPDGVKVKPDPAGYGPLDAQRDADATLDEGATGTDGTAGATDAAQRDSKES